MPTQAAAAPDASTQTAASVADAPAVPAVAAPAAAAAPEAAVPAGERCSNCGALTAGRFCSECGQRREHAIHSVGHFLREATEDLTHADSRVWRTLAALLFRPGFLTREFFAGRRARYLPPVRLYLVLSVVFFLAAAGRPMRVAPIAFSSSDSPVGTPGVLDMRRPEDSRKLCAMLDYGGPWKSRIEPALKASCAKVAADQGRTLQEQFLHNLPRAMFVFLPLLAAFMKLMYWRPRRWYVEHLLFFVHGHAAAFLMLSVSSLAHMLAAAYAPLQPIASTFTLLVSLYLPYYLYQSMRYMYGQGHALTTVKFTLLALIYLILGAVMMSLVVLYSYLTL